MMNICSRVHDVRVSIRTLKKKKIAYIACPVLPTAGQVFPNKIERFDHTFHKNYAFLQN
jgi:hypothetical protein